MSLSTSSCCSLLSSSLPNLTLSLPGSSSYNSSLSSFWSLQEASLKPGCIAFPSSSQDVSDIVSVLTTSSSSSSPPGYGNQKSCPFAIKSGGHAPSKGFANIASPGVTIDLSRMDQVGYDAGSGVARVGSGAVWEGVYSALDPYNVTVAGGRNGAVGVGGLTLGGGISYFSPQVGFTCDTVVGFEVVLAGGKAVEVDGAGGYGDLFRALKGGTNNFGVVTRVDFKTLKVGEILAGSVGNDIGNRKEVFGAFAGIAGAKEYDVHASIVMGLVFSSSNKKWSLASTPIYTKPVRNPPVYKQLFAVPQISNTMNLTRLHIFANESATPPLNWMFQTGTYGVSAPLLEQIFDICNQTVFDFTVPGGVIWDIAFEPLPSVFVSRGAGNNVLGTTKADGNGVVMLLTTLWPESSSSTQVRAKALQLLNKINSIASKMNLVHEFVYANYADASQNPFASYGMANQNFLRKTARKYDPSGVFQKQVPGGFKLGY